MRWWLQFFCYCKSAPKNFLLERTDQGTSALPMEPRDEIARSVESVLTGNPKWTSLCRKFRNRLALLKSITGTIQKSSKHCRLIQNFQTFWFRAIVTAAYLKNLVVSQEECNFNFQQNTSGKQLTDHLKLFECFALLDSGSKEKSTIDPLARKVVFLRIESNSKAYRLLVPKVCKNVSLGKTFSLEKEYAFFN